MVDNFISTHILDNIISTSICQHLFEFDKYSELTQLILDHVLIFLTKLNVFLRLNFLLEPLDLRFTLRAMFFETLAGSVLDDDGGGDDVQPNQMKI